VVGDVSVDSKALFVINFVNLKIKPAQSFGCAYRGRVCACIYRGKGKCSYVYEYLHLYCVSKKSIRFFV
jgi:hypothetical protein